MDDTSVNLGGSTRDLLKEYKQRHEHANYDEAIRALLEESSTNQTPKISN